MTQFGSLPTVHLAAHCPYKKPAELPEVLHPSDPAFEAMHDFKSVRVPTIHEKDSLHSALLKMRISGFHTLLVVDAKDTVLGLISSEDILGNRPLLLAHESGLSRADLHVKEVMVPYNDILTLEHHDLRHAKVGHIMQTLQHHHKHYALVVEMENEMQVIRGMFSSHHLSKHTGIDITSEIMAARNLLELQQEITR